MVLSRVVASKGQPSDSPHDHHLGLHLGDGDRQLVVVVIFGPIRFTEVWGKGASSSGDEVEIVTAEMNFDDIEATRLKGKKREPNVAVIGSGRPGRELELLLFVLELRFELVVAQYRALCLFGCVLELDDQVGGSARTFDFKFIFSVDGHFFAHFIGLSMLDVDGPHAIGCPWRQGGHVFEVAFEHRNKDGHRAFKSTAPR